MTAIKTYIAWLLYYLSLNFAYSQFMLPVWGADFLETSWGEHAQFNKWVFVNLAIFSIVCIGPSLFKKRASDFLHAIFFAIPICPMLVISGFKSSGLEFAYFSIIIFYISYAVSLINFFPYYIAVKNSVLSKENYPMLCMLLGGFIVLWCLLNGGLNYINFDFTKVYEFRRGASASRGALLNYILLNYVGVLLPVGVAIACSYKKYRFLLVFIFINLAITILTASKAYFFVTFFAMAIYFLSASGSLIQKFIVAISAVLIGLTLLYLIIPETFILGTLFIRRYLFVPAYVNFLFFDFFSNNAFVYWADSSVSLGLIDSPYNKPTPQVIGDYYSGVDFSNTVQLFNNANTGLIGAGFGHAGYYGVIIYSLITGVLTKSANYFAKFVGYRVAVSSLSFYFFAIFFTSTDLPAAVLSYGLLAFILILVFWKENINNHSKGS